MKEAELLSFALSALKISGLVYWRVSNGASLYTVGGKTRMRRSSIKGFPDLAGITPQGVFWAMELKTKIGRVTPEQKDWLKKLYESNANTTIARTPEEILAFIELMGGKVKALQK